MTLDETRTQVDRALAALANPEGDRAARANAAYAFLSRVAGEKHDLPVALRADFNALWSAFHPAETRIAEILTGRERFTLFGEAQFSECIERVRAFSGRLAEDADELGARLPG